MDRRRFIRGVSAGLLGLASAAKARQADGKIPRIGIIFSTGSPASPNPLLETFKQELRDLGRVEGQGFLIEARYAEGKPNRIPGIVDELIQQNVDIIVATNNVAIIAAKKATKTIPIVMVTTIDPVAAGYVDSLARPGANITGLALLTRDLSAKRVELLKEVLPKMVHVAVLWDPDGPGPIVAFKAYESAAREFKLRLLSLEVRGPNPDFNGVFQTAGEGRADTLIVVTSPLVSQHRTRIVELANTHRLPAMYEDSGYVSAGGLLSYAANSSDTYRRAASYVDRILKGAKPGDLPIEQPTRFELVVNLKSAKALRLAIPRSVMLRADRVIE